MPDRNNSLLSLRQFANVFCQREVWNAPCIAPHFVLIIIVLSTFLEHFRFPIIIINHCIDVVTHFTFSILMTDIFSVHQPYRVENDDELQCMTVSWVRNCSGCLIVTEYAQGVWLWLSCSAMQYKTMQRNARQCERMQDNVCLWPSCSAMQHKSMKLNARQCDPTQDNAMQCRTCSAMQHNARHVV